MAKTYEIKFESANGTWFWSEKRFTSERKAREHAESMIAKHPKAVTDYIIAWS